MGATAFSYDYSFRQLIPERKHANSTVSLLRHPHPRAAVMANAYLHTEPPFA